MRKRRIWPASLLALCGACNAVLGVEEGYLVEDASDDCVLNSDCGGAGEVCLFRVCSPPCAEDQDCANGARCVKTADGVACAVASAASCGGGSDCPEGTECRAGACRISCTGAQDCLGDQRCDDGVCVGTDPDHDPVVGSGGASGSGGTSGSGGAGTGGGGMGGGGMGGAGSGGTGGTGGGSAECEANETRCNPQGMQETCSADGTWGGAVACPFVCSDGDCVGQCVPEDSDCLLGVTPRICDEFGAWQEGEACPAVCVDGQCEAACMPGERQCSGRDLLLCNADGVFELEKTCEFLCDTTSDACTGACLPNSQRCLGNELQICGSDANWSTLTPCPFVCAAKAGAPGQFECSGECVPNSTQCSSITQLQTCDANGRWGAAVGCVNQACGGSPAQCQGECTPGSVRCGSPSQLQTCNSAGSYVATDCAAQNRTCVASGGGASCSGVCAPGQQQCASNRVQSCNAAGQFADSANCTASNQTCVASGGSVSCAGSCAPGQLSCVNNDVYGCSASGAFTVLSDDCNAPTEICSAGVCAANTPYTLGFASASGWADFNPPNDLWHVVPIQAPRTANVISIRLIGRAAAGIARLALWQNANGAPGAFVAQTDNINLAGGTVGDAPIPLATKVTGGQTYWLGAKFANNAQIYQNAAAGQTMYRLSQSFSALPSALNPFPAGSAETVPGVALNFHLFVQDESL